MSLRIIGTALWLTLVVVNASAIAEAQHVDAPGEGEVCLAGACFPERLAIAGENLPLRGTALLEYLFFDVYSAGFYAEDSVDTVEEALSERRKAVIVQYHRSLDRKDFVKSTEEILENNPDVQPDVIRSELTQLYALYKDVGPGDRYGAYYVQGKGTTLQLNGVKQGTIPGEQFQRAYFSIWLSRHSVDRAFTESLLGKGKS